MNKYLCIHGHFYQPPRENPWLEEVEMQDSAQPYHDWNQRITAECYAPNATARILDDKKNIINIINNYSMMSFNFGPTLLSWMERNESDIYHAIINADKESQEYFEGHGSAIAQAYNHMIMPLATMRDKYTQIIWGIKDFESRFERKPEGMWLPETAVDLETLDIMAELGIKYTILAPRQASQFREIGHDHWQDVGGAKINTRRAYKCNLNSGRTIDLFFYDGHTSQDIAFSDLLKSGQNFANRLLSLFSDTEQAQIVHIATDGETYGHHHNMGDMALAYCLDYIRKNDDVKIVNYGAFLEHNPPMHEVKIFENSSWSCIHGVERWKNNCGCCSGGHSGWSQNWRQPLREAMDWLRDNLIDVYEKRAGEYLKDVWKARDDYIGIILNRANDNVNSFFNSHAAVSLSDQNKIDILKLIETQRHAMLMYTSCGWFFDEVSGLETTQILQYAARAIQLTQETSQIILEKNFLRLLEKTPSNIPKYKNAAKIYKEYIKPTAIDLLRVGAHYAVSSLFEEYQKSTTIYSYAAINEYHEKQEKENQKVAIGKARVRSDITWEEKDVSYAVLHLGDHNLTGGVREFNGDKAFSRMQQEIMDVFKKNNTPGTIRFIEKHFNTGHYSLWHLFKDEQIKVLYQILDSTLEEVEKSIRAINDCHYPIIQIIKQLRIPLPKVLSDTVLVMLNADLLQVLGQEMIDFERLQDLVDEVKEWSLNIDKKTLGFAVRRKIDFLMGKFLVKPDKVNLLEIVNELLRIVSSLSLDVDFWKAQNIYFSVGKKVYREMKHKAEKKNRSAKKWIECFDLLGEHLNARMVL